MTTRASSRKTGPTCVSWLASKAGRSPGRRAAQRAYAKEWGWFRNFFCPVMKHLRTDVEDSRKRRIYDAPLTPFGGSKPAQSLVKSRSQPVNRSTR